MIQLELKVLKPKAGRYGTEDEAFTGFPLCGKSGRSHKEVMGKVKDFFSYVGKITEMQVLLSCKRLWLEGLPCPRLPVLIICLPSQQSCLNTFVVLDMVSEYFSVRQHFVRSRQKTGNYIFVVEWEPGFLFLNLKSEKLKLNSFTMCWSVGLSYRNICLQCYYESLIYQCVI